ncbi:MAG: FkbM family methyltransferase [Nitrososphaeraceae archaeon]|jgi:FkbM family methyltransferase
MKETVLWLLKGSEAVTIFDKCILFIAKVVYLSLRISLRIILSKERRDRLCIKYDIDYGTIWYKCYNIFKPTSKKTFLKCKIPKYNLEFYCRNGDDFKSITMRENDIIERFCPRPGDIVIDVGAHIGKYTIIASKRIGANGKVIAIEAHPVNYEMLNRNIKLNGLTNVTTLNYAVYSKETKLKLFLPDDKLNHTIYNTLIPSRAKDEEKFIQVNANTLDNLLQKNGMPQEVNWIKIDVEGAELEVLKGAHDIISRSNNIAVFIEVHNIGDDKNNLYRPIMDLMEKHNFTLEFENTYGSGEKHIILHKQVPIS